MKWALIIWLQLPSNSTVYDTFNSKVECEVKREQLTKALKQAESKMRVFCYEQK
jgi:hypothetical protein